MLEALLKRIRANDHTVTQISLGGNGIGAQGAQALAEALKQNHTVTQIILNSNNIGAQGAQALAEALKQNQTVTQIDLLGNKIGNQGARALALMLKQNQTVTQINLDSNDIGAQGAQAMKAIERYTKFNSNYDMNRIGMVALLLAQGSRCADSFIANMPAEIAAEITARVALRMEPESAHKIASFKLESANYARPKVNRPSSVLTNLRYKFWKNANMCTLSAAAIGALAIGVKVASDANVISECKMM